MPAPVLTSLGHAGMRIDAPGVRLLCDPWLSPGGAFFGSWWPYPDNRHMLTPQTLECDWVVVSHAHLDHLDTALLGRLASHVRVVIPRYPSTHLRDALAACGVRHIVELAPWQRLSLSDRGDWLTVIPELSPMCHDAGLLLHIAGRALLLANDARLSVAQCRRAEVETGRRLDVMAVQMSGASWHPICYDYPAAAMARLTTEKRLSKFKSVTRLVRTVSPRVVMPYAGPPCFLDPELAHHNAGLAPGGIFPDQHQALEWLAGRLPRTRSLALLPGDMLDLAEPDGRVLPDPQWAGFSFADRADYLADYAARRARELAGTLAAFPAPADLGPALEAHFARLAGLSPYFLRRIDMTLRFAVSGPGGGEWDVHVGADGVRVDSASRSARPGYRLQVASRWLAPVLAGSAGWEDLLLSLRISASRDPDEYNDYLVGLLKHADRAALNAIEAYDTARDLQQTVEVGDGSRRWAVSRFCPHAGEDLLHGAVVEGGRLRCLGHNFDFDLQSGTCLNARCDPLVVRPVAGMVSAASPESPA